MIQGASTRVARQQAAQHALARDASRSRATLRDRHCCTIRVYDSGCGSRFRRENNGSHSQVISAASNSNSKNCNDRPELGLRWGSWFYHHAPMASLVQEDNGWALPECPRQANWMTGLNSEIIDIDSTAGSREVLVQLYTWYMKWADGGQPATQGVFGILSAVYTAENGVLGMCRALKAEDG
ncbi:hypothetical protein B0H34DRAFT_672654 [Crassisporium funariophilum]|nr:hypothetical protein B0H34DRAFT_672654 [Crassisporium funariophilum]